MKKFIRGFVGSEGFLLVAFSACVAIGVTAIWFGYIGEVLLFFSAVLFLIIILHPLAGCIIDGIKEARK